MLNVSPIFNKGRHQDPVNYRQILLTPVLCKELEKFIREAITEHLNKFGLNSNSQYGFYR